MRSTRALAVAAFVLPALTALGAAAPKPLEVTLVRWPYT